MFRKRQSQEYVGRHRVRLVSSGQHKQDGFPPPDKIPQMMAAPTLPVSGLLSSDPPFYSSQLYDTSRLHGIDPDLVSPLGPYPEEMPEEEMPPWRQPRKIRARYIAAATVTGLVGVPALIMAGWIAGQNRTDPTAVSTESQFAPETAKIPLVLDVRGNPVSFCITLANYGPVWKASASAERC